MSKLNLPTNIEAFNGHTESPSEEREPAYSYDVMGGLFYSHENIPVKYEQGKGFVELVNV